MDAHPNAVPGQIGGRIRPASREKRANGAPFIVIPQ